MNIAFQNLLNEYKDLYSKEKVAELKLLIFVANNNPYLPVNEAIVDEYYNKYLSAQSARAEFARTRLKVEIKN
jgi:hypothetical protein